MSLSDAFEKLGRTIFEAPFHSAKLTEDAPELAEIRLAVVDVVKAASHRAGSVRVFPFDVIRILLRGIPREQAAAFESGVLAEFLSKDLRASLARSSIRCSANLIVRLRTTPELPLADEPWLVVETERTPADEESARAAASARLVVMEGVANAAELALAKSRIHIGRTAKVFRSSGPSRRNDLVFSEDNEINRTVSREHAHIVTDKISGERRLFNDRWYKPPASCELWILRDGLSRPVHRGGRGAVLEPGDEIHIGRAVVRFEAS
jgi:hypothetical protein